MLFTGIIQTIVIVNSGSNSGGDSDNVNKSYNAKIIRIQDKSDMLVNHGTKTSYTLYSLRPDDQLVPIYTLNLYKY